MIRRAKITKATMDVLFAREIDYEAEFDSIRSGYPNQIGREQALRCYIADRKELGAEAPRRIRAALANYLAFLKREDQSWRHPQNLKTFFHNWRDWEEMPKEDGVALAKSRGITREMWLSLFPGRPYGEFPPKE